MEESSDTMLKYFDCLGTPLVEVFSVSIYVNDDENNNSISKVYGTIQLTDGEGTVFDLYKREENDEETVSSRGGSLTLTRPKGRAISPFYQVEVEFDIKDKARSSVVIAKGFLSWDYTTKEDYDQVQTEYVRGECGYYAAIRYITYRYAVIATVDVALLKTETSDDASCVDSADIYGKIVARCESTNTYSSILFEKPQNESVRVKYETCINLSRHVLSVPATSSLVIATNLWYRDTQEQICCEDSNFPVTDDTPVPMPVYVTGKIGVFKVMVSFTTLYMQPPPERKLKHRIEEASNEESTDHKHKREKLQLISDHAPLSALSTVSWNVNPRHSDLMRKLSAFLVMEVFSITISNNSNEGCYELWGTIKVLHWRDDFTFIFNRDKKSAERLLGNQTAATITGPTTQKGCFRDMSLVLQFDLKDSEGHEISAGSLDWTQDDPRFERLPLLDRQLCSVIKGDSGYAAVHYSLFYPALQATVNICYVSETHSTLRSLTIHGNVYTEYSNYKYITRFEKEHFRSRLFMKRPENPEVLPCSSHKVEVPLLKNVVALPLNISLIVDIDLSAAQDIDHGNIETSGEMFHGRLSFSTHGVYAGSTIVQNIQGNCQNSNNIAVSVKWSKVSLY